MVEGNYDREMKLFYAYILCQSIASLLSDLFPCSLIQATTYPRLPCQLASNQFCPLGGFTGGWRAGRRSQGNFIFPFYLEQCLHQWLLLLYDASFCQTCHGSTFIHLTYTPEFQYHHLLHLFYLPQKQQQPPTISNFLITTFLVLISSIFWVTNSLNQSPFALNIQSDLYFHSLTFKVAQQVDSP